MGGLPYRCLLLLGLVAFETGFVSGLYDITTIYKFQRAASGTTSLETGEIIARGNARGMPLRRGATVLNTDSEVRCCTEWENDGWRKMKTPAALDETPILDPSLRENPQDKGIRKTAQGYLGSLEPGETIRMDFTPAAGGGGYLEALLCDTPFPRNCYGVAISGHLEGRLRYYWMRFGPDGKQGPFWVPGGGQVTLRASVDAKEESIREGWVPVRQYVFRLERTPVGQLLLHLDGGDAMQEEERVFDLPERTFKYLFIERYKQEGELRVQSDPAWQGRVDANQVVPLTWGPADGVRSRLGVFFCTGARADDCYGALVTGSDGKALRVDWAKYGRGEQSPAWLPGHAADKNVRRTIIETKNSVPESWNARTYNLTVRQLGYRAELVLGGGATESWELPAGHTYIIIASHKSRGLVEVHADVRQLSQAPFMWPVWVLDYGRTEASFISPPIKAPPQHQLCVTVGAKVPADNRLELGFKGYGPGFRQVTPILKITPGERPADGWTHLRTVVDLPLELVRRSDRIQLVLNASTTTEETVYVQFVDLCNAVVDRDITTFVSDPTPVSKLYGFDVAGSTAEKPFDGERGPCKHGGILDIEAARCRCPPGFQGKTCEIGCGNNLIGADCKTRCSDNTREGCEGLLVCGPGMPCTCASGFRGPACDRSCPATKYGPNCQFTCGRCYEGESCDPYTGLCFNGCSSGFQPPLCNQSCGTTGKEWKTLIVRGNPVNITSFPWHAALYAKDSQRNRKYNFVCGGSLVSENLVLTAAHCVSSPDNGAASGKQFQASNFMVALGKTRSDWDAPEDTEAVKRKVYDIVREPYYRGKAASWSNDIALLVLEKATTFSRYVTPVCLNWRGDTEREGEITLHPGSRGVVVGWGESEAEKVTATLYSLEVALIDKEDCINAATEMHRQFFTKDKICAGHSGILDGKLHKVAKGDSGGGLCFRDSRGTWYVRGVVSLGLLQNETFATYTDVNAYRDFISDVRDNVVIDAVRLPALAGSD